MGKALKTATLTKGALRGNGVLVKNLSDDDDGAAKYITQNLTYFTRDRIPGELDGCSTG